MRIPTISNEDRSRTDPAPFAAFHEFLESTYPLVHQHLGREVVAGHSLLYTWEGADPGAPPVLLMGHMDVVEMEPGTEGNWEHPPFAGERDEEYLWGRGTPTTSARSSPSSRRWRACSPKASAPT